MDESFLGTTIQLAEQELLQLERQFSSNETLRVATANENENEHDESEWDDSEWQQISTPSASLSSSSNLAQFVFQSPSEDIAEIAEIAEIAAEETTESVDSTYRLTQSELVQPSLRLKHDEQVDQDEKQDEKHAEKREMMPNEVIQAGLMDLMDLQDEMEKRLWRFILNVMIAVFLCMAVLGSWEKKQCVLGRQEEEEEQDVSYLVSTVHYCLQMGHNAPSLGPVRVVMAVVMPLGLK